MDIITTYVNISLEDSGEFPDQAMIKDQQYVALEYFTYLFPWIHAQMMSLLYQSRCAKKKKQRKAMSLKRCHEKQMEP